MKKIIPIVLMASLWGGVQAQETTTPSANKERSETLVLTLEQALEIALSESPTVKIADKTIETKSMHRKVHMPLYGQKSAPRLRINDTSKNRLCTSLVSLWRSEQKTTSRQALMPRCHL
jgi:hypothetical protein